MNNNMIFLPTLNRVKITNYSLFSGDIDYKFVNGVNLIVGGNGVGKTTFISIIKYALIGLYKKDLDVKIYKGEKRLVRDSYTNGNTFFRNRTKLLETDKLGHVELWFSIRNTLFYVRRSLYDIKLEAASYEKNSIKYEIEGNSIKQELYKAYGGIDNNQNGMNCLQYNYEKIVSEEANLSDFDSFIFFVNQVLLFGESRETILWTRKVQDRLLSNFLNDAALERKRKELSLEAKYQDSVARHKQEEIKAIVRVLNQIDNKESKVESSLYKDRVSLMSEIEGIKKRKEQVESSRDTLQKKIDAMYKQIAELSHQINDKEKEKERAESRIRSEYWPGVNVKYAIYKRQYLGNRICPVCNSDLTDRILKDDVHKCFFCNSEIAYDESKANEIDLMETELGKLTNERNSIEKVIMDYEKEMNKYDYEYRNLKVNLFNKEKEMRALEVGSNNIRESESSYKAMINRIDELTVAKENALRLSEKYQTECEKILKNIEENVSDITRSISSIFKDFAEAFMKISCYLTLEETEKNKSKVFLPVIDNKVRYDQEELSESQRFFVDYSFRMSLLSYFYECPSFYICETPDSSLDISYEENAVDTFMKYLERPNTLVLTSNLNNSTFIKCILDRAKEKSVLNLLKYGKVSSVQLNHEMLNRLSQEVEEICNE